MLTRTKVEVVTKQIRGRSCISVSRETKNALDAIKHPGQSYDGLIQELIKFWREKKGDYWTRRREQRKGD